MIVTDKGIVNCRPYRSVEQETMRAARLDIVIFDSVIADPPETIVLPGRFEACESGRRGYRDRAGGGSFARYRQGRAACG